MFNMKLEEKSHKMSLKYSSQKTDTLEQNDFVLYTQ